MNMYFVDVKKMGVNFAPSRNNECKHKGYPMRRNRNRAKAKKLEEMNLRKCGFEIL